MANVGTLQCHLQRKTVTQGLGPKLYLVQYHMHHDP